MTTLPPAAPWRALADIPHCGYAPVWVDVSLLRDTLGFARKVQARCGPLARAMLVGRPQVLVFGAEDIETVLAEPTASAAGGWAPLLGDLFPHGLILRDGADHREHRRRMLPALRRDAIAQHLQRMTPKIRQTVAQWLARGRLDAHEAARHLTLHLASDVFLGVHDEAEVRTAHEAFAQLVSASAAVWRVPLPLTRYARGLGARRWLADFLQERIAQRRRAGGDDLFSQLCVLRDGHGVAFSDKEIVDHMIFLWMAAHDTTRSAITTMLRALALAPQWQRRLREEACATGYAEPTVDDLAALDTLGWTFKEALRMFPPIPTLARQLCAPLQLSGKLLPAGSLVTLFLLAPQRDSRWWPQPDDFEPDRHAPSAAAPRPRCAWAPFGGGAHMCLGQHFAQVQAKAVLREVLRQTRFALEPGSAAARMAFAPIAHPPGGLPLRFEPA